MPTRPPPRAAPSSRITRVGPESAGAATTSGRRSGGRQRVVIENVLPCIDCGRFAIKRVVGEQVEVVADIFADGHDVVATMLAWRSGGAPGAVGDGGSADAAGGESCGQQAAWREVAMMPIPHGNDRWRGEFRVEEVGHCEYRIIAWVDRFATWQRDTQRKVDAGVDVGVDLLLGADLLDEAAQRAGGDDRRELESLRAALRGGAQNPQVRKALSPAARELVFRYAERRFATESRPLPVWVDREKARFSTWYELFPRSTAEEPGRHGTFHDVEKRLAYIAEMGFDVLYLPPIHPIGRAFRKGKNNTLTPGPDDVGSPWAIGGPEGGHKSIHPELGTMADFEHLVEAARERGIEVALDIAYQCSPDHPYVRDHPEWFRSRPDGSIQYAENPPKKYQDIYPFDFETEAWESLWQELKSIVEFWIDRAVKIFRVDNPHTKAFAFWEWMIAEVRRSHPEVIFLSEAFTRPRVMYRLAKLGFNQSYTYFAWKNEPWEIEQYWRELTQTEVIEYFRPNAWPNTPDILNDYLQNGGRGAYMARLVLAATLCASYGIYGPPFEQMESIPRERGSEEYLDSEKYQLRHWDLNKPGMLKDFLARVNRIRRGSPALQQDRTLCFHRVDNPALVCYSKTSEGGDDIILCIVNTDPFRHHWGMVDLDMPALGLHSDQKYQVHDLLTEARYIWHGPRNMVGLDPAVVPAHIFRVLRHVRSEHDFEYYM
jgi:starch synthase (maltosyl-transferring)